jgi:hypothetical protein
VVLVVVVGAMVVVVVGFAVVVVVGLAHWPRSCWRRVHFATVLGAGVAAVAGDAALTSGNAAKARRAMVTRTLRRFGRS